MLGKLKLWGMAFLGILSAVLYGLWKRDKAAFAEYRERQAKALNDAERAAHEALEQSRKDENKEVADALKDNRNDYFE